MNDAEAEAVLLALGSVIEWTRHQYLHEDELHYWHIGRLPGSEGWDYTRDYTIEEACRINFNYHTVTSLGCRHAYETLAAAKAACEHHRATGEWE